MTSAAQLNVQQIVQVEWSRTWFPADVLRINPNGMIRIHYRGWSSKYDEDVPLPRIQLAHEAGALPAPATAAAANQPDSPTLSESGQPNYSGPGKVPSSGHKVVRYTQLKPGLIVQVAWGASGTWFPADVLKRNPNGTVRIHFRGWPDNFDEDVPLNKIQLAHDGVNSQ